MRFSIAFVALIVCSSAMASEKSVDLHVDYLSQTATNVRGGDQELWRYADEWAFSAAFDLQKLIDVRDARFQVTLTDRNGRNLSVDANLGSLQEVQGIYGRGQTWHWTQFYYSQKYLGGMLDWKIGRLVGGEDFADFPCEFMNLTFCGPPPGNTSIEYWYNWPVSTWATRLRASFNDFGYVQVGAYEANPRYLATRNGLNLGEPGGATGVLVPLEVAWQPTFGNAHSGTYKFGVWYNTSKAPDVLENVTGQPMGLRGEEPRIHNGHAGAYINFLQQLPIRGVSVFLNATFNDRDTSALDSQIATGLFWHGPFAARPADLVGLAVGRTHLNSRLRASEATTSTPSAEYVGEVFYSVRLAHWIEMRPGAQLIHQRGRLARNEDTVILGVRISAHL